VPATTSALEKRIRRHVTGREHEFFAVTAPGLETVCRRELKALDIPVSDEAPVTGGVTFRGRVHDCYRANLHLRTATRILMRLGAFHAAAFSELEKRCADIPWELYLPAGRLPDIHVTTAKSRLYHKGAIAQRIHGCIKKRFASHAAAGTSGPGTESRAMEVFVRSVRDRFVISIDSSGELLHKRGLKTHTGRAPLRETLAAAALIQNGYAAGDLLVDPMCGSGTFTLEAAMISAGIPAGWFREFAFFDWPCFRPPRWGDIRRSAEAAILHPEKKRIFASDADGASFPALRQEIARIHATGAVTIGQRDFFDTVGRDFPAPTGTIVLNPPYNRRMGTPTRIGKFYRQVRDHLVAAYPGWRVSVYCPNMAADHFAPILTTRLTVPQGGLTLALLTGTIPDA